jgi:SAM-dependent methyltransferase
MSQQEADKIRQSVRSAYTDVAEADTSGVCCGEASSCCGVSDDEKINSIISTRLGYSTDDRRSVPGGADLGLGCGNPRAIAGLKAGETVLDLGSGGGFDAFLAAQEVGEAGHVIGVDMTPAMISKARVNAEKAQYRQVEFRLGEIEHLPVADDSIDVIISNCVINLSPNKPQVFREMHRVLKKGGRLAISDVVATTELPDSMRSDPYLHSACVAGAETVDNLHDYLSQAGFSEVDIQPKDESREFIREWVPGKKVEDYVLSATLEAVKY